MKNKIIVEEAGRKLSDIKKIIIHPGSAHRDDFLATGLAIYLTSSNIEVERKEPSKEELGNSQILVLDVGGRHEPELKNFDHHQFPSDTSECAFSIFSQWLKLEHLFKIYDWYEVTKIWDSQGPKALADYLNFPTHPPVNPFESSLTGLIRDNKLKNWHKLAGEIMGYFVERSVEILDIRIPWFRKNSEVKTVAGMNILVADSPNTKGIGEYEQELLIKENIKIDAEIWPDNRGDGWRLMRLDDNSSINFRKLNGEPAMRFIHANGFTASTKEKISLNEILVLMEKSITL